MSNGTIYSKTQILPLQKKDPVSFWSPNISLVLQKEYSMNSGIPIVPFLPFKMRDVSVHATRAAGGHHLLTNFKHHLISLCWSCPVLWLEGSGTAADAKHNKRKAVEYQGEVGGEITTEVNRRREPKILGKWTGN